MRPLAVVVAALAALAWPAGAAGDEPTGPQRSGSWAARIVAPTQLRARPGGPVVGKLNPLTSLARDRQQLMVTAGRRDAAGALWLRLRLPSRPNDAAAWVRGGDVRLHRLRLRVEVDRASRRLTVRRRGRRIGSWRIVVGAPSTPSPRGTFAVYEIVRQGPGGVLGPWALHLTAHSDVLLDFGGGPGRVALHGRSGALLADPLGTAASHGCIRMDNDRIAFLARRLAPGTPVLVR